MQINGPDELREKLVGAIMELTDEQAEYVLERIKAELTADKEPR